MIAIPEELELLEFFENEPIKDNTDESVYIYQYTDEKGVTLVFSFNEVDGSVQSRLIYQESDLALFSQEGASKLSIEEDNSGSYINCQFDIEGVSSSAKIYIKPRVYIKWNSLLK